MMREDWCTLALWYGHGSRVGDEDGGLRSWGEGGGALILSEVRGASHSRGLVVGRRHHLKHYKHYQINI